MIDARIYRRAAQNRGHGNVQVDDYAHLRGALVYVSDPALDEKGEQLRNAEGDPVYRRRILEPQPDEKELASARAQVKLDDQVEAAIEAAKARVLERKAVEEALAAEQNPGVREVLEKRLAAIARA